MKKFNTKPASGTRDFLPEDMRSREQIFDMIKKEFEIFGFSPMDTPTLERIETLMGKYGEEGNKLVFKILKRGGQAMSDETDLALRYDLTVPLARFFAQYQNKLLRPFRRYQIGPVWRADRPGAGRFREFYQCDVDIVGSQSLLADAEVIIALTKSLSCLNLSNYVVRINSSKILMGLLQIYGIPENFRLSALIALDKLDKIGVTGVLQDLKDRGLPRVTTDQIRNNLLKKTAEVRDQIKTSPVGQKGLEEVDEVISLVKPLLSNGRIEFFPFLARGLDYYTGPIFEIYVEGVDGAIASGGRYDDLIGTFAGKQIPACGGSLGIDRILSTLKINSQDGENKPKPEVFITVWDRASQTEALRIATELRDEGISTEISLEEGKIANQLRFASKRGAAYCIFYGPDEQAKEEITLKNLLTGTQMSVERRKVAKILKILTQKR